MLISCWPYADPMLALCMRIVGALTLEQKCNLLAQSAEGMQYLGSIDFV